MIKNKRKPEQFKLITDKNFPFAAKEAYNSLRTNLLYALSPTNGKIVAVTSSNAGEGKSTVSINLALTMAAAKVKILVTAPSPVQTAAVSIPAGIARTQGRYVEFTLGLPELLSNLGAIEFTVEY